MFSRKCRIPLLSVLHIKVYIDFESMLFWTKTIVVKGTLKKKELCSTIEAIRVKMKIQPGWGARDHFLLSVWRELSRTVPASVLWVGAPQAGECSPGGSVCIFPNLYKGALWTGWGSGLMHLLGGIEVHTLVSCLLMNDRTRNSICFYFSPQNLPWRHRFTPLPELLGFQC